MTACLKKIAKKERIPFYAVIGAELNYDGLAPCLCSGRISLTGTRTLNAIMRAFDSDKFVSLKNLLPDILAIKNESDIAKLETSWR
ncbi:MAG: hypothetical protein LBO82_09120 [Synergistaceae bacterium]|jgi:hypothetical protein|nr:hypothetical protein [Synergistaceae bacterium]